MLAGLVNRTKVFAMEKILWRATRGNVLFQTVPSREQFREVGSSEMVEKDAFAVFFQGERTKQKIQKICESFGGIIPIPLLLRLTTSQQRSTPFPIRRSSARNYWSK